MTEMDPSCDAQFELCMDEYDDNHLAATDMANVEMNRKNNKIHLHQRFNEQMQMEMSEETVSGTAAR